MAYPLFRISLKACRVNAGLSQEDLAKELGVTKQTIVSWESGKSEPSAGQFKKISALTGVPMDYIDVREPNV